MPKRRLLKFDVIHPSAYLRRKQEGWADLDTLPLAAYRDRLNRLRSNYSDYYTHHLDPALWEAEEFYLLDPVYLDKTAQALYGNARRQRLVAALKDRVRPRADRWTKQVVEDYVRAFDPDVLFVRSQPLPSAFWRRFRDRALLVARLSARLPKRWHPEDFDVVYTDVPLFRDFFELHGVAAYLNDQGFDERILGELRDRGTPYDVTFVGGLGSHNFSRRTELFERIAGAVPFRWWGYWWDRAPDHAPMSRYPNLERTFQGPTSGLEMFQIYKDSKVVLNDYVDTAGGLGVNQRMYEVLGVGSFMLTRQAPNFEEQFPGALFGVYHGADDCLSKLTYYLGHAEERRRIARAGQAYVLEHFNYRTIVRSFDHTIRRHLDERAP